MKEIVFGINPVFEAVKAGRRRVYSLYYASDSNQRVNNIIKLAEEKNIKVKHTDKEKLYRLTGTDKNQGIAIETSPYLYYSAEDIINTDKKYTNIIILDGITDPHNLGAIIRTADIFNFDGIILRKERSAKINSTVIKTSAGATEYMKIAMETNLSRTVEFLQENNFWIFAATEKTDKLIYNMNFNFNSVIIIGDEGIGISQNLLKKSDFQCKIPVMGNISSLNASVSSAILMYEIIRQQKSGE